MDLTEIFKYTTDDFKFVGNRLSEIRNELQKKDQTEHGKAGNESQYSRENIGQLLGVSYNTMTNLERGILTHNTFKLIHLYYSLGYNPSWILIKDNDFINKKIMQENLIIKSSVHENYKEMSGQIEEALKKFKSSL